jgi:hypothetical protein
MMNGVPPLEPEIDRLYQLPLDEFTGARNALAKSAGKHGAQIRGLRKPPVAAWAINQLYWRQREVYTSLIDAARAMRAVHAAVLSGKPGDLRSARHAHETALQAVLEAALRVLVEAGHPVTDATRQAIATTLRALPADEPPGRLTRTLEPVGFEMLTGISVRAKPPAKTPAAGVPPREASQTTEPRATPVEKSAAPQKAVARAHEALAAATRAVREAEKTARREELEATRAARQAEEAARAVDAAREALESARRALADGERARETAERRSRQAGEALAAARRRAEAAEEALDALR